MEGEEGCPLAVAPERLAGELEGVPEWEPPVPELVAEKSSQGWIWKLTSTRLGLPSSGLEIPCHGATAPRAAAGLGTPSGIESAGERSSIPASPTRHQARPTPFRETARPENDSTARMGSAGFT